MSEYRPFPTDSLPHDDGDSDAHDHEGHGHEGHDHDDHEAHDGQGGQFQGRPPRPAPNTEHPGGHLGGTVARLNRPRRFGFIRIEEGTEVFFHASAIDSGPHAFDALRTGQEVEVTCHQDDGGRGLAASVENGELVALAPDKAHPITQGFACNKGIAGLDIHRDPDRLARPLKRQPDGAFAPLSWDDAAREIAQRLRAIVADEFAGKPLWAVKDPRMCRLMPLWRGIFRAAGTNASCLIVLRSPVEVARSLARRDDIAVVVGPGLARPGDDALAAALGQGGPAAEVAAKLQALAGALGLSAAHYREIGRAHV